MVDLTPPLKKLSNFFLTSPRVINAPLKIHPSKILPFLLCSNPRENSPESKINDSPLLHFKKNETPKNSHLMKKLAVKRFTAPSLKGVKPNRSVSPIMKYRVDD